MRAGPGLDFHVIACLEPKEKVEKIEQAGDWVLVRVKRSGQRGWVHLRYLSAAPVAQR